MVLVAKYSRDTAALRVVEKRKKREGERVETTAAVNIEPLPRRWDRSMDIFTRLFGPLLYRPLLRENYVRLRGGGEDDDGRSIDRSMIGKRFKHHSRTLYGVYGVFKRR